MSNQEETIEYALLKLLVSGKAVNQEWLCQALQQQGHDVNQSKISRLLRKLGVVKAKNEHGEVVYAFNREPAPPPLTDNIAKLIIRISKNEQLLVVFTSPGSAQLVARILDYHQQQLGILATIAGDDSILCIPTTISNLAEVEKKLWEFLFER